MYDKDTTLTPLEFVNNLGEFDLDPCGFEGHKTAKKLICLPEDGLNLQWSGRVFLNPPYSDITPWARKISVHGNGIMLVLASVETEWFQDFIFNKASGLFFNKGRPKFIKPFVNGVQQKVQLMRPTCFVSFDSVETDNFNFRALEKFSYIYKGKLIKL